MGGKRSPENDPSFQAFETWIASKTDDDFRQMVFRGNLNREDIAKECHFSKSVLNQNERVEKRLLDLEADLRKRGVLPPIAEKKSDGGLPMREYGKGKSMIIETRLRELEYENADLKADNRELRKKLALYEASVAETGRIPR